MANSKAQWNQLLAMLADKKAEINQAVAHTEEVHTAVTQRFTQSLANLLQANRVNLENKDMREVALCLKSMEKEATTLQDNAVQEIFDSNKQLQAMLRATLRETGDALRPYIDRIKTDPRFGADKKAKAYLTCMLQQTSYVEVSSDDDNPCSMANFITGRVHALQACKVTTQSQYLDIYQELSSLLNALMPTAEWAKSQYADRAQTHWFEKHPREAAIAQELLIRNVHNKFTDNLSAQACTVSLSSDCASKPALGRAIEALEGVFYSLSQVSEYILDLMTNDADMALMHIKDAMDHLSLSEMCYHHNVIEAYKKGRRMDTASRELISDNLWDFLCDQANNPD